MTLKLDGPLLLAGAGNMGYALLTGWLERGLDPARIIVQDPAPSPRVKERLDWHRIQVRAEVRSLPEVPAVLLVAVKPQVMDQVFPPLGQLARQKTVVLSVAAGRRIDGFEAHLPPGTAVVRAMPNTPASVGRGITVAVGNGHVTPAQRDTCDELLRAVGEVAWVERRGPDGCRDGRVGLRARLRLLSCRVPGGGRRQGRAQAGAGAAAGLLDGGRRG